jgi:hypothetical protein
MGHREKQRLAGRFGIGHREKTRKARREDHFGFGNAEKAEK